MQIRNNPRMTEEIRRIANEMEDQRHARGTQENERNARGTPEDERSFVPDNITNEAKQKIIVFACLTLIFVAFVVVPIIFFLHSK